MLARRLDLFGLFAALSLGAIGGVAAAQSPAQPVVVVELFTSQGCSACPQADALLGVIATRDDVVALAFHVDYWDYLGWSDGFADPSHGVRQQEYADALGGRSVYTPQMVVHGAQSLVGHNEMAVMSALERHAASTPLVAISVARADGALSVTVAPAGVSGVAGEVILVGFSAPQSVSIGDGENSGHTLTYHNIVRDYRMIGEWSGLAEVELSAEIDASLEGYAVIVQRPDAGEVLAAARVDL